MKAALVHGGALDEAVARYGGERAGWLDLSTGIAPTQAALPAIPAEAFARLPERAAEEALRDAARACYGAPPGASVVLAPGTQSLISLWPHLFAPTQAAIVSPTYEEHVRALLAAGHEIRRIADLVDRPGAARLVVVVNPNNPDGRRWPARDLLAVADDLARKGGLLVVDEAFMDPDPAESVAAAAGRPGLLVLRSFGKFFGLAGLRLGFALTEADLAARLERRLGPWPVSGPAIAVATALMADADGLADRRAAIAAQHGRLVEALSGAGLSIEGATRLFALVRHARAFPLFEALARRHVLTRPFADAPTRLRFGNPADAAQTRRLAEALRGALSEVGGA